MRHVTQIVLTAVCALVAYPALAQHVWKKITFSGEILTQTCEVKFNGADDGNVKLKTVYDSAFSSSQTPTALETITLSISKCTQTVADGVQKVNMLLRLPAGQMAGGGYLINNHLPDSERAEAVRLAVYKDDAGLDRINFTTPTSTVMLPMNMQFDNGNASYVFSVAYVNWGNPSNIVPGKFSAALEYRLQYL